VTALRAHRLELALLAVTTIAALVVLRLVDTQIYTEPWTIDPWLYTALMANFDFTYHWFNMTYYAARLPLIVPGLLLNSFLTPEQAYVVLHLTFFLIGGVFLYLLVRSLFGMRIALFVYPAFLTNAVYVDAHTWDYFDGFVITYLSCGLYFLVSSIGRTSRVRPALAGFFLAAATATNLFAALLVLGAILAYLYGRATVDRGFAVRRVALDAAWFSLGAAVLLAACGWFAKAHDGRFLFFMNSIEALDDLNTAQYKLPTYDWLRGEPRLLVPLFVGAAAAIAWRRSRSTDPAAVGLAVTAAGVGVFLVLVIWEFMLSGTFLQLSYYSNTLYPFLFVALATAVFGLLGSVASDRGPPLVVLAALGLIAGAAPLVAIYGLNRDDLWGERGSSITLILMGVTIASAIVLRFMPGRRFSFLVAPFGAVLVMASVNYGSAANATTHLNFETNNSALGEADETFAIGTQLMAFMRSGNLQDSLPAFWYDSSADTALIGLQSLYYFGFTYLNLKMPLIDDDFRSRTEQVRPRHIILLCTEPTCRHGAESMRRAGYRIRREAAARLHSGSKSIWVQAYALKSAMPTHS
jgi:hypothetical protein